MQAAADILDRLWRVALRRRAPLWLVVALPWAALLSPLGVAVCALWAGWDAYRLRARVRSGWIGWLNASLPALEDSGALLLHAEGAIARMQRARILARIDTDLRDDVVANIVRERVRFDWRIAALSLAPALALLVFNQFSSEPVSAGAVLARLAQPPVQLVLRVTPPRHTALARFESAPRDLEVPQSSLLEWCLRGAPAASEKLELGDGRVLHAGRQCARASASGPILWRWRGRRFKLTVRPDAPPQVAIVMPKDPVHVLPADAHSAAITVRVRDDYRLRRAVLHFTLARGEGDDLQFSEREMAVPGVYDARSRTWSHRWSVEQLGMQAGDELYFYVRATDNGVNPQTSASPVYTLRLPLPDDEDTSARARRLGERIARYQGRALPASFDGTEADLEGAASSRHAQGDRHDTMPAPVRALLTALSGTGPLPAGWQRTALDWLADATPAAQLAVQDVADGCQRCRDALRARLRTGPPKPTFTPQPALRVGTAAATPFTRAWQPAEGP